MSTPEELLAAQLAAAPAPVRRPVVAAPVGYGGLGQQLGELLGGGIGQAAETRGYNAGMQGNLLGAQTEMAITKAKGERDAQAAGERLRTVNWSNPAEAAAAQTDLILAGGGADFASSQEGYLRKQKFDARELAGTPLAMPGNYIRGEYDRFPSVTGTTFDAENPEAGFINTDLAKALINDKVAVTALTTAKTAEPERFRQPARVDAIPATPESIDETARAIAEYRIPALTGNAMRNPQGAAIMAKVREFNADYRAPEYNSRNASLRDFTTGPRSKGVQAFGTALEHLDTLEKLTKALDGADTQRFNVIANLWNKQTGNPAPTNFLAAKKIVGDEIVKSITAGGGGVYDREEIAHVIDAANSPAQLLGVIETFRELMVGQLHNLKNAYEVGTKATDFDARLSPIAREYFLNHPSAANHAPKAAAAPEQPTARQLGATPPSVARSTVPVTEAAPVRINSPDELAALPSGAKWIAPDGKVKIKP